MRRTKIVCTLGPASHEATMIAQLVEAGLDCARLNFSHGTHEEHLRVAERVREASSNAKRPIALLADLSGPKMRVGSFAAGAVELDVGQTFTLTTRKVTGDETQVSVAYEPLPRDVGPGDQVLLDDGLLRLRVLSVNETDVRCEVEIGGTLSDQKGINVPGGKISAPAIGDKDRADLAFAVQEMKVDFIALSFVRSPDDVKEARRLAEGTPVVAKIERPDAVERLDEIAQVADGVMIARGDLGVELGSEKVPLVQKRIIREVNERGKLVITATQMLDSMMRNPRPTRAEAADVANAVIDGTDAVMLSGETAAGRYPIESVQVMDKIICEVERGWLHEMTRGAGELRLTDAEEWSFPTAAARAAALMSRVLDLKAVVTFTHDGRSANLIAEYRSRAPIIAITPDPKVANRLAVEWGVVPRVEVPPEDLDETLRLSTAMLVREGLCTTGDAFAMVLAWPLSGRSNTVKLHRL